MNSFLEDMKKFEAVDLENYFTLQQEALERERRKGLKEIYDIVKPCKVCGEDTGIMDKAKSYDNGICPICDYPKYRNRLANSSKQSIPAIEG